MAEPVTAVKRTNVHPAYTHFEEQAEIMRDAYEGEEAVKRKGLSYLPACASHVLDGMETLESPGYKMYFAYRARANFPDYVEQAVRDMVGMICAKPAKFQLPKKMEYLLNRAGSKGQSLAEMLREIYTEIMVTGRLGLLGDINTTNKAKPKVYVSKYAGERILDWDDWELEEGLDVLHYLVLDESGWQRENNSSARTWVKRFRVCKLQPNPDSTTNVEKPYVFSQAVFDGDPGDYDATLLRSPMFKGTTCGDIPFEFVNANDLNPDPDKPPLLSLARLCFAIYRGDADYRQCLHMQGQDTLVVVGGRKTGEGEETRVGAGAKIDVDLQGDAKYIGIDGTGLAEQRKALENQAGQAEAKAGQLVNPNMKVEESGQALHSRMGAQTASLKSIAMTGCAGLESVIKMLATWIGEDPEEVKFEPNLEFTDVTIDGQQLVQLMTAREAGMPLSFESIHKGLRKGGMTDMDYETEKALIKKEDLERRKDQNSLPPPPLPPAPAGTPKFNPKPNASPGPSPTPKA